MLPARCITVHNLMAPHEAQSCEVRPGTLIRDLDPHGRFPAVCRLDGQWLLRAGWDRPLGPGQVVEFYIYPQGGGEGGSDATRIVLMVAALYIAIQFGQWQVAASFFGSAGAATAVAQFALVALVNALVPANTGNEAVGASATQSSTYTTNISGNQARLEQPIPVLYGRNKTYPDFAAESYTLYGTATDPNNNDQYYHALLCIGQGEYAIDVSKDLFIDDTNLSNFSEVEKAILPPGVQPTFVTGRFTTAPEVTGNEVVEGRYIGPFVGCRPQTKCVRVGIDIVFPRGLATYDGAGVPGSKSVSWRVDVRSVDDFGAGLSRWVSLGAETVTASQTKPLRRSYNYPLPYFDDVAYTGPYPRQASAFRPQVRLVRTTPFDDNSRVANTLEWAALRCELQSPYYLCPTATHLEIKMRASQQLSGLTQRRVAVISRRKLRTWNGTTWTAPVETRNAAWALADKWTNLTYGDRYPDDRCDLDGLLAHAIKWDARQDRFDGVFDKTYESFQADQMIAQSGRAAVFRRGGVMTLTRDELKDMPVTAYTARNIDPGSMAVDYSFPNESTPDGVIVEFWHNRTWDWQEIVCPAPGVTTPARAQRMRLFGVTGPIHAQREGLYQAANSYYRRRFASFTTELEGMLPAFGSAVVFSPNLKGWGRSGDVVDYNSSTREVRLTEPVEWTVGAQHYFSVMDRKGALITPILVTPGSDNYRIVLATALPFTPSTDQADEDRTKYIFGTGRAYETVLRILSIRNSGDESGRKTYSISGVLEDDRVHTVDNALLPVDATLQDPVPAFGDTSVDDGTGSGAATIPYIEDASFTAEGAGTLSATVRPNGTAYYGLARTNQYWVLSAPRPLVETALFEIYVQIFSSTAAVTGSLLDTWLPMTAEYSWGVTAAGPGGSAEAVLQVFIREISTGIMQTYATWTLYAYIPDLSGGS